MAKRHKNTKSKRLVDWTILPPEILDTISDKLLHLSDYARFSAVCKSWNFVAAEYQKQKLISESQNSWNPQNFHPPMLMFIDQADHNSKNRFFKLSSLTNYFSMIDQDGLHKRDFGYDHWTANYDVMCLGSYSGWLAMKTSTSLIILVNPLIRKVVEIPSIPLQYGTVCKIILSCDPRNRRELVIAALTSIGEIGLITLGQQRWTLIHHKSRPISSPSDMIFHEGFLYIIYKDNDEEQNGFINLFAIDYKRSQMYDLDVPQLRRLTFSTKKMARADIVENKNDRCFLVEASNGDLLLVEFSLNKYSNKPTFKVCKVEFEDEHYWSRTEMGRSRDAMFLSDNSCLCIPANVASGAKHSSIYFSFCSFPEESGIERTKTGIYDLGLGKMTRFRVLEGEFSQMVPIALLSPLPQFRHLPPPPESKAALISRLVAAATAQNHVMNHNLNSCRRRQRRHGRRRHRNK